MSHARRPRIFRRGMEGQDKLIARVRKIVALAGALLGSVVPAPAGQGARVIDGDTLVLGAVHYRLSGIDAPELRQACADGWPAGEQARAALARLVESRAVTCRAEGSDRYGRTIARCTVDDRDIGRTLVEAGMAWAYVRYSSAYGEAEQSARAQGLGVHGHGCTPAWTWRRQRGQ